MSRNHRTDHQMGLESNLMQIYPKFEGFPLNCAAFGLVINDPWCHTVVFLGILRCVSLCLRKIWVAIFVLRLSVVMCSMEVLQVCICAEWDLGPQQGMLTLHTPWMNTQQMTMRSFRKQGNNDLIYSVDSSFIYIYCVCACFFRHLYHAQYIIVYFICHSWRSAPQLLPTTGTWTLWKFRQEDEN